MEDLILQFGYVMVFLIAAIEGEGALLAGAILAQRGQMSFAAAIVASFLGTFLISEGMYHFGRTHGRDWVQRRAAHNPRLIKVERWLETRGGWLVLWARFLWGVRIWIPAICGVGGMRASRFFLWNFSGAVVWTAIVAPVCYFFGEALRKLPEQIQNGILLAVIVLTLGVMFSVLRKLQVETDPDSPDV